MKQICIRSLPGYDEWQAAAKRCLLEGRHPYDILWQTDQTNQRDLLLDQPLSPIVAPKDIFVPAQFIDMAKTASCHARDDRFAILYRILWRIVHENKHLLKLKTDDDVLLLNAMIKAVRRDAYKITAFLRFREIKVEGNAYFIAWYEPEHYSLELKLDFFTARFKNMRWSILTPYRAAHWDMKTLTLEDNPDPSRYPQNDRIEDYWLTYYASIFNPARVKKKAMLSQMPKKYWKNMPETVLIDDLLKQSESRAKAMIDTSSQSSF